jgi:hypothetical protein
VRESSGGTSCKRPRLGEEPSELLADLARTIDDAEDGIEHFLDLGLCPVDRCRRHAAHRTTAALELKTWLGENYGFGADSLSV